MRTSSINDVREACVRALSCDSMGSRISYELLARIAQAGSEKSASKLHILIVGGGDKLLNENGCLGCEKSVINGEGETS